MSFLYRQSAQLLQQVQSGKGSLKTLCFGGKGGDANESKGKRKVYALTSETLRYMPILEDIVRQAGLESTLMSNKAVNNKPLAYILLYELLLGKGSIQGGGKLKKLLISFKDRLEATLTRMREAKGIATGGANELLLDPAHRRLIFPRYARVNLLKTQVDEALEQLRADGLDAKVDALIPTLLALPAGTELHDHPMVVSGALILQDKSSCFPAEALLESWQGGDIIDACAAPGNKTSHLASLLHQKPPANTGEHDSSPPKVFAFEKDLKRLEVLKRRCGEAGALHIIQPCLQDFLEADPGDKRFANVKGILLDPSCSGSGIVNQPDRVIDRAGRSELSHDLGTRPSGSADDIRLGALADFQVTALLKAFSFPGVARVTYSTCSVHTAENEEVVAKALNRQVGCSVPYVAALPISAQDEVLDGRGRYVLQKCIAQWHRRGMVVDGIDEQQAVCMGRALGSEDNTNGFFVALLVRKMSKKKKKNKKKKKKAKKASPLQEATEELKEGE
ncbi:unnamed protein product [Chrysoparadoxa australica]